MKAEVLSPWIGDGLTTDTAYRPKISDDYTLLRCTDATDQPAINIVPDPNLQLVRIECDALTFSQIEGDPTYMVIWHEE